MWQLGSFFIVLSFALDRVTKWLMIEIVELPLIERIAVLPFFTFQWVENKGVSFGMFADGSLLGRWALVAVTGLIVVVIGYMLKTSKTKISAIAFGLIIGGALGNIYDRVIWGYVADFLQFHYEMWSFAVFNGADVFICMGATLLLIEAFFLPEKVQTKPHNNKE